MLRSPAVKRVVVRPEDVDKEALHKVRSGNVAFFLWKATLGLAHAGEVLLGDDHKGACMSCVAASLTGLLRWCVC